MKYETILFDLDGTITDPGLGITSAVAYSLDYFGNKYESLKALELFIGPPLREQFMEYCGVDREKGEEYVAKYREYYAVKGIYENKVYTGIEEMLKKLKLAGKRVVLATSKRARQIIDGAEPLISNPKCDKPLSIAVEELYRGEVKIVTDDDEE